MTQDLFKLSKFKALFFFIHFASEAQAYELDLEMTGQEYTQILKKFSLQKTNSSLNKIIETGKRNLEWFNTVNAHRPSDQQLALYNPDLIAKHYSTNSQRTLKTFC
jgi:hypothetical protein